MDIEYRIPLLNWLDNASNIDMRHAIHICLKEEFEKNLTEKFIQNMKIALPNKSKEEKEKINEKNNQQFTNISDSSRSSSSHDDDSIFSSLPAFSISPLKQLLKDTVENMEQVADYLITEQVRKNYNNKQ
jgi:type III secretory pathway component EscR